MDQDEPPVKRPAQKPVSKVAPRAQARRSIVGYVLSLYVAGTSNRSRQAILRARELCANELRGQCVLEVIDIYQDPRRARDAQIVATPTLVRENPRPVRRLIGTSGGASRLFACLRIEALGESGT
jgi:circadian clock protein KaiB